MRRPITLFTSLLLSASLIGGSALAQSGAGPNRADTPNGPQVCASRDGQGQPQPCSPDTQPGRTNAQPGQARTIPSQANPNTPNRSGPAQAQERTAQAPQPQRAQVQRTQLSRVDVYLDGRLVLDNVTRQQAARLRVGPGNHRVVVVLHGQPLTSAVATRTFRAGAATTLQLSFGDGFSLSLR